MYHHLERFKSCHILSQPLNIRPCLAVFVTLSYDLLSFFLSSNLPHSVYINIYIYLQPPRVLITFSEAVTFCHNLISGHYLACVLRSNVPSQAISTFRTISSLAGCSVMSSMLAVFPRGEIPDCNYWKLTARNY
jgi:hypothetical protein